MSRRAQSTLIFAASAVVNFAFIINLCAAIYQCGCTFVWSGGNQHCNIHQPVGRHCPWCAIGNAGFSAVLGIIVVAQALVAFKLPVNWPARLVAALATFPVVGTVEALIIGFAKGYWS
jgi:hypothetical protein